MLTLRSTVARGLIALPLLAGVVAAQPALAAHRSAAHKTISVLEKTGKATAGYVFAPVVVTIKVGDTVSWKDTNAVPHNVVGQGSASKVITKVAVDTKSYSVTFKKAGTYKYLCNVHPGMVGQVIVK